jgi:hypothetical protein
LKVAKMDNFRPTTARLFDPPANFADDLIAELTRLRRGWALQHGNLRDRLGPIMHHLCGIDRTDTDRDVQRKVRALLTEHLADLPAELRRAAVLALAMDPNHLHRSLTVRVERLAHEYAYTSRTARRRIDHAFRLLALAASRRPSESAPPDPGVGWHVRSLHAALSLDNNGPELLEERAIVATRSGLDRVTVRLSVPVPPGLTGHPSDVTTEVVRGATIVERESHYGARHFRCVLQLPQPLAEGQEHEFAVVHRVSPARRLLPHYAFVPLVPCDRFSVSVRFQALRWPAVLWRLTAVPPRLVDDEEPGDDRLDLDGTGTVRLRFSGLRAGHAYGVAWRQDAS